MLCCLKKLVFLTIVLAIGAYAINFWLGHKSYIFKESDVKKIGKKYVGYNGSAEELVEAIRKDFKAIYPHDILPKEDVEMLFFGLGGFKGCMFVYHVSLTEYLIVFGTPIETTGYQVRQWVNRTDVILSGESSLWKDGTTVVETQKTGSVVYHEWGSEAVVKYTAGLWKLSYGRGFVASSFPHSFATFLFHSQDYYTFYRIIVVFAKSIFNTCIHHCSLLSFLA